MIINKKRNVEKSERGENGMYNYYYEYDLYEFIFDEYTLIARSYTDEPNEVHFLNKITRNKKAFVEKADLSSENMLQAISYLKRNGKKIIKYLANEGSEGYITIKI